MIDFIYNSHSEFISLLYNLSDEKYKEFSYNLAKTNYKFIGVRIPILKQIAKCLSKQNFQLFFENCTYTFFEEIMVFGFLLKYLKSASQIMSSFKNFVYYIDSWSLSDSIIADLKVVKKHKEEFKTLLNFLFCDKEFYARCGYVFLLDYYICDDYINYVFEMLNKEYDFYYVNMAKAWLLSKIYINYPYKVLEFLKNCKNDFVVNKTISKIRDSYQVNKLQKNKLTEYKR